MARWTRDKITLWWRLTRTLVGALFVAMICISTAVYAQRSDMGPDSRSGPPPLPQLEEPDPPSPPNQLLPPVLPPPPEEAAPLPPLRVFVKEVRVVGSSIFSAEELREATQQYVNRVLTTEDLEELRLTLTRYYIDRGYVTSGAIIPDQNVTDGVLSLRIIEGKMSRIEVTQPRWFREGYIRRRLALGARPPVRITALQQRLQLLQQDDRIERLDAELRPGTQLGESELYVQVTESLPFRVVLGADNYQSPSVGAERGFLSLAHRNLTGRGDILRGTFWFTRGLDLQLDASYALPLTARDTTLFLRYSTNETDVVEEPFGPLDIKTESETFEISLRQPLYRTIQKELAVALIGERRRSKAVFFQGEPFPFLLGSERGETTITPIRLSLEWTDRSETQVMAIRSRFTVGLDALGATTHSDSEIPDGRFFAWLGQFQWVRRLDVRDMETLFRLNIQLANDALLPLEQIGVGGRFSVRGYRENLLLRDNALMVSLETRIPLVSNKPWADILHLAPFIDFGNAWNTSRPTPEPRRIASIGIGLRWAVTIPSPVRLRPQLEVYWGYPLKDVETVGGDLQDLGLHLQFTITTL